MVSLFISSLLLFLLFSTVSCNDHTIFENYTSLSFDEGYTQLFGDNNLLLPRDGKTVHISHVGARTDSKDPILVTTVQSEGASLYPRETYSSNPAQEGNTFSREERLRLPRQTTNIFRLEGKVALITGGATGIGKATAKLFCLHGARVVIADVQDDLGKSVCTAIGSNDVVTFIHCDVSKEDDIKDAVEFTVAIYGKLDIMFNNAGIIEHPCPRIMDFNVSEFERTMSINCTGVFIGIKHTARAMVKAGIKGSIINNASVCSVMGGFGPHGYVASKHAVVGLTKNGAVELGQYGIRVNCISPYLCASSLLKIFSGMNEQTLEEWGCDVGNLKGALLKAEDIAHAALFLGSDESKYVSGHNFVIDGGVTTVNNSFGLFKQEA